MGVTTTFFLMALIFLGILLVAGYSTKNWSKNADDFSMAGREVGTLVGISSVLAISFAGSNLTLIPNFTITFGLLGSGLWCLLFSLGFLIYGLFPGRFLRRSGAKTLPEWLQMRYGSSVRIIVSLGTVIGLCGILANNIASFSTLLASFMGISEWISVALCFVVMILFTAIGGQWAVKVTDFIQVIIGAISIPLVCFLLGRIFGWDFGTNWPVDTNWITAGHTGLSLPIFSPKYPSFLTFAILNAFFLVWGSNYYFLTAACMRSEKTVRKSFGIAAIIQIPIVYLPLIFIGLMAVGNVPGGFSPTGTVAPTAAFSVMLLNLSAVVASFAMLGVMSASISTASTALVAAQSTATRDIYLRKLRPNATPKQAMSASRIIVVIIGVVCLLLTFYPGGPTYLFAFSNAWMGPPAVLLLLGMVWRRVTGKGALWGVVSGMAVMAVFTILDLTGIFVIGTIMHVGVVGLIVTLGVTIIGSFLTQPKYYGQSRWNRNPQNGARKDVDLQNIDHSVLSLIASGMEYMMEIADCLPDDIITLNESIERLDQGGYICRSALTGAGFYEFTLSEKGTQVISSQFNADSKLRNDHLTTRTLKLLRAIENETLNTVAKADGISDSELVAWISVLDRNGYIQQHGFMRRHVELSAKGSEILKKYSEV